MHAMAYRKSIVIFIALFMCFSMLLKYGVELTAQADQFAAIVSINDALDDVHEVQADGAQESLFEENDDLILTVLDKLPSTIEFPAFFLLNMYYVTPPQLSLLRPPSNYLS
jgi:hypothetical protein